MEFKEVPIDMIKPNPFQPRESFRKEEIEELAESIKSSGLVQPIIVRRRGEIYEIIAGERRWRAAQIAGIKEIPSIVREADDVETRELSLIENWHRLALEPIETEKFVARLYADGLKTGRYKNLNDMSKKTGIPQATLSDLITAHREREELELPPVITYTDLRETRVLKERAELRRQVLRLREEGKISRDELREFSEAVLKTSEPVKKSLLELKIRPEEARIVDVELETPEEKVRVLEVLERERRAGGVRSIADVARIVERAKEREIEVVKAIDTGDIWICPICHKKYYLIHIDPTGTHKFEEVVE